MLVNVKPRARAHSGVPQAGACAVVTVVARPVRARARLGGSYGRATRMVGGYGGSKACRRPDKY